MDFLRRQILLCLAIFLASTVLMGDAFGDMKGKRPTVSDALACDGYDCEGAICACCYEDGCWICGRHKLDNGDYGPLPDYYGCEWEQAARRKGETKVRPGSGGVDRGELVQSPDCVTGLSNCAQRCDLRVKPAGQERPACANTCIGNFQQCVQAEAIREGTTGPLGTPGFTILPGN
jgi:hypothetical protein